MKRTPEPWRARPRNVNNDGTQDAMAGLGWDIEGPPEPALRGQFQLAGDAYMAAASPRMYKALEAVDKAYQGLRVNPPWLQEVREALAHARGERRNEE